MQTLFLNKILLLNLLGNGAQMIITVVLGGIGMIYFLSNYELPAEYFRFKRGFFYLIIIGMFVLLGRKFGNRKIRGVTIYRLLKFIKKLGVGLHIKTLLLALARYLIFSFQFYFLLTIFKIEIGYFEAMTLISSMYLIASIIPSLSLFDWLIKGTAAVWVFNYYPVNELIILTISLLMWFLNFAIPAILGSYFVLSFKFPVLAEPKHSKS